MLRLAILACILPFALSACGPTPAPREKTLTELYDAAPRGPLPAGVRPVGYLLDLRIDPRQTRFGGTVTIDVQLDQPSTGIWLHGQDLQIIGVHVSGAGMEYAEASWRDVLKSGVSWIGFPRRFGPGEIEVEIEYSAPFDANLSGLFRVDEQGHAYALAKSESIQARRFMPGFDEPRFKAPFDVRLTIPETDTAIANTPEATREVLDDGHVRLSFKRSRPLPTYLLSLAVGSFDRVEGTPMPPNAVRDVAVPLTGYTRAGKGDEILYALETAEPMIRFFEEALHIPYPYEKLDIVAAPQWPSGATELAAAITYRESRILYGPTSGPAARRSLLNVHSHEIAHMWFGDLVTPPWWDDLWLKEAFASWAEGIVLSEIEPEGGYDLDAVASSVSAMSLDSLKSARAVKEPISINEDIRNAYDSITYNKGLAVIAMSDAYFGADIFRPAVGRYLERFEDSVADSHDFFDVIGQETGEPDLTKAFRSFVEQSGLPTVDAQLDCDDDTLSVRLTQSRYRPLGSAIEPGRRWTIPYCLVAGGEDGSTRHCAMMDKEQLTLRLEGVASCPPWIMPNADGKGYWRFTMAEPQWALLAVHFNALAPGEALTAIDSARASFETGKLTLPSLIAILEAGTRRPEQQVVREAMDGYGRLASIASLDEAARAGIRAEIQRVFRPRLDSLATSDSESDRILRSRLESFLARHGHDAVLRRAFSDAARVYVGLPVGHDVRLLTSDDFSTALAIAVQDEGRPFLYALLAAVGELDDPNFEQAAAYAIGENRSPDLVDDILALTLTGRLGTRENYVIVGGQMDQPETKRQAWAWLRQNYPAFVRVIPGQQPRSTPRLASRLCSKTGADQLDALFEQYGELAPGHERALSEAREKIELCVAFRDAKAQEIQDYFSRFVPPETTPELNN